jgi:hypothetical protein
LTFSSAGLDERLALGVAVAAAAVRDAEASEGSLKRAGGERRAVVGPERQCPGRDGPVGGGALDETDRLAGAAAGL